MNICDDKKIVECCPILYQMRNMPMTETCMCWGFECGDGWMDNIFDASCELESLNAEYYPKYRVRIQADQVKEKYGTLHFYYSVVQDHGRFLTFIDNVLMTLERRIYDRDFECKTVTDEEPRKYDKVSVITKKEYDSGRKDKYKCSNVEFVKDKDGTYKKVTHLESYGKYHQEPTRYKMYWFLGNMVRRLSRFIKYRIPVKDSSDISRITRLMTIKADEIIEKAEKKCCDTCEECGSQIGTEWSPVCQTTGWIKYLCDECAKKGDGNYYMNGKLYNKGKRVNSNTKKKQTKNRK